MYEKYLPVGTVVLLKGAKKRIMITGFYIMSDNEVFDYTGCLYPEGYVSRDKMLLFNHNQIDKIYFMGFQDNEEKTFKTTLNEMIKSAEAKANNGGSNNG